MKNLLEKILHDYMNGDVNKAISQVKLIESSARRTADHPVVLQLLLKMLIEQADVESLIKLNSSGVPRSINQRSMHVVENLISSLIRKYSSSERKELLASLTRCSPLDGWLIRVFAAGIGKAGHFSEAAELTERILVEKDYGDGWLFNKSIDLYSKARNEPQIEFLLIKATEKFHDIPEPFINLAGFYEERGDKSLAKLNLSRALNLSPYHASALSRMAYFENNKREIKALLDSLEVSLTKDDHSDIEVEELLYSSGRLHEQLGEYEKAFEFYTNANKVASKRMQAYDPDLIDHQVEQVQVRAEKLKTPVNAIKSEKLSVTPIFIVGGFRSGSTLLEQILVGHPNIDGNGELSHIPKFLKSNVQDINNITQTEIEGLRSYYLSAINDLASATYHIDKLPNNIWFLDIIKMAIPEARFIYTQRNKMDMAISTYAMQLGQALPYNTSINETLHYLNALENLSNIWKKLIDSHYRFINYESLVKDMRSELQPVVHWLGLDWSDGCDYFYKNENVVKTASLWDIRKPLTANQVDRAKRFDSVLKKLNSL